jgi:hypothetical protein
MTESDAVTRRATRLTAVLVTGWVAAALLAGFPGAAGGSADAQTTHGAPVPKIIHSGPACLAGQGAPPQAKRKANN